MNIFLGTDSRGITMPKDAGEAWVVEFCRSHNNWNIIKGKSASPLFQFILHDLDRLLHDYEDGFFDVMFLQIGFHEAVEASIEDTFKSYMSYQFNPRALIKQTIDYAHPLYVYQDCETEKKLFDLAKKKSKRCVFIGIHCLENYVGPRFVNPYRATYAKAMNARFSQLATHYIPLPETIEWVVGNCQTDGMHYNRSGVVYILQRVEGCL